MKKSFANITVDTVGQDQYKKQLFQAQIRQVVTTTYPSAQVGNNMSDNLFAIDKFDLSDGASYDSTRVTWIPVPSGTTVKQVEALLKKSPEARIYKVLSNSPILTENQKSAIKAGLTTEEAIGARQAIVDQDTGELILHNGLTQYSANFFSLTGKADEDTRATAESTEAPFELAEEEVAQA